MKSVSRLVASKDAVRSHKTLVNVSDTYSLASKKNSKFYSTPVRVASFIRLAPFTSLHTAVMLYSKLH